MANHSAEWTRRFNEVMPCGSSTRSKAPQYAPEEPGVIVKGRGCRVWDADGREFIDFRNSLGPITLGYCFPAVDEAIRKQLESGIVFGHPHPLECEVAELLCEMIPCAEQARFLKTGGEAVAAAIRAARHHTGRDHVVQIGYNGWLNRFTAGGRLVPDADGADPSPGVPKCLSRLHHPCDWNDAESMTALFERFGDEIAAVVVSAGYDDMAAGETFYPFLRRLTRDRGALLILDEIVTGFRIAVGGAGEYFDVRADLAVFAKGIANGMPLSAYVGSREAMSAFDEVPVTSTLGGETLSLAAARATLETYRDRDVVGHLWRQGEAMWTGLNEVFTRRGIGARMKGFWPAPALRFADDDPTLPERFYRAAYANGVSLYALSYVNLSHADADVAEAIERLEKACGQL